jgi:hypothetical protein
MWVTVSTLKFKYNGDPPPPALNISGSLYTGKKKEETFKELYFPKK